MRQTEIDNLVWLEMPIIQRVDLMRLWIKFRYEVDVDRMTCYRIYRALREHSGSDTEMTLKFHLVKRGILRALAFELIEQETRANRLYQIARSKMFITSLKPQPINRVARRVAHEYP